MLDKDGKVHLCDFGVSQFFDPNNDTLKGTFGTLRFMAPEMQGFESKAVLKARAIDIWAAGVTLYYMKTKKYPFDGKSLGIIREQLKENKPDLEQIENEDIRALIS